MAGVRERAGNIVAATKRMPAKAETPVAPKPSPTTTEPTSAYIVVRSAAVPIVSATGLILVHLLGGTIIVENLFGFPGLGRPW